MKQYIFSFLALLTFCGHSSAMDPALAALRHEIIYGDECRNIPGMKKNDIGSRAAFATIYCEEDWDKPSDDKEGQSKWIRERNEIRRKMRPIIRRYIEDYNEKEEEYKKKLYKKKTLTSILSTTRVILPAPAESFFPEGTPQLSPQGAQPQTVKKRESDLASWRNPAKANNPQSFFSEGTPQQVKKRESAASTNNPFGSKKQKKRPKQYTKGRKKQKNRSSGGRSSRGRGSRGRFSERNRSSNSRGANQVTRHKRSY